MKSFKMYLAEGLGTLVLVFVGAGAVLMTASGSGIGVLGIALAHGLALMVIVYTFGGVSGAHVNPAVTFGMWVSGKMKTVQAIGYVIAQLAGAAVGALLVMTLLVGPESAQLGATMLAKGLPLWQALCLEALLTFFLVWSVMATNDKKFPAAMSGLTIGMTLAFGILVGGVLTGGALNPARAFGPALVSGYWMNHLIYWAGPLLGGFVAALAHKLVKE